MSSDYNLLPANLGAPTSKWHGRLRRRQVLALVPVFSLFFALALFFYWGDLALYAFPERVPWISNAENFDDIFLREADLPQHNLSAAYPEGRNGRFVRFTNQVWGLGWNNILQERLLNTILAYESNRAPVFTPFETWAHPPRDDHISSEGRKVLAIPYTALLSGPTAGAPWPPGDHHPRAINDKWWEVVCPVSRRRVIDANEIVEKIGREIEGKDVMRQWTSLLRDIPDNCIEVTGTQIFDFYLIGSTRLLSLWHMFSSHPVVMNLQESQLALNALDRNLPKLQSRSISHSRSSVLPSSGTIAGLVAIHIRRGDYKGDEGQDNGHCLHAANWASTFTGWCQLPQLVDKFMPPARSPDVEWGKHTPEIAQYYLERCLPTPTQVAVRLRTIRSAHRTRLSHVFVATNAEPEYLAELREVLSADGWARNALITSKELDLNWQATSVGVAVDMAVMSRAEVFIGNGFSSLSSNVIMKRITTGMPLNTTRLW